MSLPSYAPAPGNPKTCNVLDGDPNQCFANASQYDVLSFQSDVTCSSEAACCGAGGAPLIALNNTGHKSILGNGHTLHRQAGQKSCSAIQMVGSKEMLVDGLSLDEDAAAPPCELSDRVCAETIRLQSDTDVKLNGVNIYYGKGYVVQVLATDGFSFSKSAISEAGIIGLYVGYGPSTNVAITDSVIARTRTNGIALQGAYSTDPEDPILVTKNILTGNHWHGLWSTGPGYPPGTVTGGGQVLVADGQNVRVVNNIIADGYCENCYPGPSIVEMELNDGSTNATGVLGLTVEYNYFYDNGPGSFLQPSLHNDPLPPPVTFKIDNNHVVGQSVLTNLAADSSNPIFANDLSDAVPSLAQGGVAS